jgi:choline dehydrogenase-like flavoprotein
MADYDLISVGGGLGGSALAKVMAEGGARVLVLERERRFRDRVRGEALMSWGVAEARTLAARRHCWRAAPSWRGRRVWRCPSVWLVAPGTPAGRHRSPRALRR